MAVPLEALSVTRAAASPAPAQPSPHPRAPAAAERSFAALFDLYSEDNRPGLKPHGVALDPVQAAAPDDPKIAMDRWQPRQERSREAESTLGLGDMLDALNPLHHIPGVASLYRKMTGDEIAPAAKVVGGTIYGGPIGLVSGLVNAVAEQVNGAALDQTVLAFVFGDGEDKERAVAAAPHGAPEAAERVAAANAAPAESLPATLTGSDALAAFARDIGRADRSAAAVVTPAAAPPDADPKAMAAAPGAAFAEHMMLGLDKYRQMAIERGGPGQPAIDRRL